MYLAGWVHRDISSGNILYYRDARGSIVGKLSDLEYAKKFNLRDNAIRSSDPKVV